MIKELQIKNFKAFGPLQKIPLKPITLIYGANSAGKSSILHSLMYLNEMQRTQNLNVSKINTDGGSVDLGGAKSLSHKSIDTNIDRIRISFKIDALQIEKNMWYSRIIENNTYKEIEIKIMVDPTPYDQKEIWYYLSINIDSVELISFVNEGYFDSSNLKINLSHPVFNEISFDNNEQRKKFRNIIQNQKHEDNLYITNLGFSGVIPDSIKFDLNNSNYYSFVVGLRTKEDLDSEQLINFESEFTQNKLSKLQVLHEMNEQLSKLNVLLAQILDGIQFSLNNSLGSLISVGPFRSYPTRNDLLFKENLDYKQPIESRSYKELNNYNLFEKILYNKNIRENVNNWLSKKRFIIPYQIIVNKYMPVNNIHKVVEKYISNYISFGKYEHLHLNRKISEVTDNEMISDDIPVDLKLILKEKYTRIRERRMFSDATGESITELENSTLFDYVVGEVDFDSIPDCINEINLMNLHTKRNESLRDTGVGISQILPIIAYSLTPTNQLVLIEEPEIHLHPALQSELGDLFIDAITDTANKQLLIETHSEHILLRIMRRIRETTNKTLPEGTNGITPDDVAVLFVQPEKEGYSTVLNLRLDENGEFLDPWPGGFFEEGFNEMFS